MIDLSLARSYLPVCVCFFKIALLCLLLSLLRGIEVPPFNIHLLLAILLYLDRCLYKEFIFSTNTLTSFVLFAIIFDHERITHTHKDNKKTTAGIVLNLMWACITFLAMYHRKKEIITFKYIPFHPLILSSAFLFVHSFIYHLPEVEMWLFLRIFDFMVLCIGWIYFVDVQNASNVSIYDCTDVIIYFGIVLFTSITISSIYSIICCVFFLYTKRSGRQISGHESDSETDFCASNGIAVVVDQDELHTSSEKRSLIDSVQNSLNTTGVDPDNNAVKSTPANKVVNFNVEDDVQAMFEQAKASHMRQRWP